jgi:hypothetical protein
MANKPAPGKPRNEPKGLIPKARTIHIRWMNRLTCMALGQNRTYCPESPRIRFLDSELLHHAAAGHRAR